MSYAQVFDDVALVVKAMREGGMAAAQAKYAELVKDRGLVKWQAIVFREHCQKEMEREGLWKHNPLRAQPSTDKEPDANCITTPDGGCVGGTMAGKEPCMHDTPTTGEQTAPVDQSPLKEQADVSPTTEA